MKALAIYIVLVMIGIVISFGLSWLVEVKISRHASLAVFIVTYFGNFAVCWMIVRLIMDGHLRNEQPTA